MQILILIITILSLGIVAIMSTFYIEHRNQNLEDDNLFLKSEVEFQKERASQAEKIKKYLLEKIVKIENLVINNDYVSADLLANKIKEILQTPKTNNISK